MGMAILAWGCGDHQAKSPLGVISSATKGSRALAQVATLKQVGPSLELVVAGMAITFFTRHGGARNSSLIITTHHELKSSNDLAIKS